jgi:hypothetical protein
LVSARDAATNPDRGTVNVFVTSAILVRIEEKNDLVNGVDGYVKTSLVSTSRNASSIVRAIL